MEQDSPTAAGIFETVILSDAQRRLRFVRVIIRGNTGAPRITQLGKTDRSLCVAVTTTFVTGSPVLASIKRNVTALVFDASALARRTINIKAREPTQPNHNHLVRVELLGFSGFMLRTLTRLLIKLNRFRRDMHT